MNELNCLKFEKGRLRICIAVIVLALFCIVLTDVGLAQTGTVRGTAVDEGTGEPLIGANVVVLGTTLGGATGRDGSYVVNVPPGSYQLQCSYIGFKSQTQNVTVSVDQEASVDFQLDLDPLLTEAVVKTGVASATSKAIAPIAVQRINARQLTEVSEYNTIHNLLAGKVAGVSLQQSQGAFGIGTRMIVRAGGGISGNGQPVFYVDGIKVENRAFGGGGDDGDQGVSSLVGLNPEDIESVEIIKGPAGASSYGTGGSNGVVLITTKRGRFATSGGKNWSIRYKGTFGYNDLPDISENEFRNFEYLNNNFFEKGAIVKNSVNISGGTDKMRTFLSIDRNDSDNHTPRNSIAQTNLRANIDFLLSPKFNIRVSSQFVDTEIDLPSRSRGGDEFGYLAFFRYPYDTERNLDDLKQSFWNSISDVTFMNSYTGSVTAEYSPFLNSSGVLKGLSARLTLGVDDRDNRIVFTQLPTTFEFEGNDEEGLRRISQQNSRTLTYTGDASLKYDIGSSIKATSTVGTQLFDERSRFVITEKSQFATRLITDISVGGIAGQIEENSRHFRSAGIFTEHNFSLDDKYFAKIMVRQDYASVLGALTSSITYPAANLAVRLDKFDFTPDFFSFLKLRAAYGETGILPGRLDGISRLWRAGESQFGIGATIDQIGNPSLKPERVKEWEIGVEAEVSNFALDLTYYSQTTTDAIVPRENVPSSGLTSSDPSFNIGRIEGSGWEAQLHVNFAGKSLGGWRTNFTLTNAFQKNEVTDMGGANEIRQGPGGGRQVYKEGLPKGAFFNPITLGFLFSDGTNVREEDLELWPNIGEVVPAGEPYAIVNSGPLFLGKSDPDYIGSFASNLSVGGFTLYGLLEWKTGFQLYNEERVDQIFNGAFDNPEWGNGDESNVLDWDVLSQQLGLGDTNTGVALLTPGTQEYTDAANQWAATSPFFDANSIQPGDFLKLRELSLSYSFDKHLSKSSFFSNISGLRVGIVGTNLRSWVKRDFHLDTAYGEDPANPGNFNMPFEHWVGGFTSIDSEINSLGFDGGPQSAMQSGTIPTSRSVSAFVTITF